LFFSYGDRRQLVGSDRRALLDAIVRRLTRIARVKGAFTLPVSDANVVLVQDPATLKIDSVARTP
jgi:hypothetical protein